MKKIVFLPYDMDTAIGTNNEGSLVFSYNLEDTDKTESGADVFNGQASVLWNNLRRAFPDELKAMYRELRSTGALSYEKAEAMFEEHQGKWPEAVFNEDSFYKYIQPLTEDGTASYLPMLQGSKEQQRKWWLYNRFRYLDSKYNAGDALSDVIQLRGYAKADITVTPYADIYPAVKYGSYLVSERGHRNVPTTLICPLDAVNDTEIYIYSASQLADVGDLSGLMVGFADFSMAVKLQKLKLGDADSAYSNGNLTELYLGNNTLLEAIDARNCPNLSSAVDISGCAGIREAYFSGTSITGLSLPNGGSLRVLDLPGTVTNLTIRNHPSIEVFTMPTYANITTLWLENVSGAIDVMGILSGIQEGSRVRVIGFSWDAGDEAGMDAFISRLDAMRGLDESGNNTEPAQVSGTVHVDVTTGEKIAEIQARYPGITVTADHLTSTLFYYTWDGGELLHTETIYDGGDGTGYADVPSRESTDQYSYAFAGWSREKDSYAADAAALENVTADRRVYAAYTRTVRTYTVYFYNSSTLLYTAKDVPYGGTAVYVGETPVCQDMDSGYTEDDYPFEGWYPSPEGITGDTTCRAVFGSPLAGILEIADSWEEIMAAVDDGTALSKYYVGNYKELDLGDLGAIRMQIAGRFVDTPAEGGSCAVLTWIAMDTLQDEMRNYDPWSDSSSPVRNYLNETVLPLMPDTVRSHIRTVYKYSKYRNSNVPVLSEETVWIPSVPEIFGSGETYQPYYRLLYTDAESRIKCPAGSDEPVDWWTRTGSTSAGNAKCLYYVTATGEGILSKADNEMHYVAFGFCT